MRSGNRTSASFPTLAEADELPATLESVRHPLDEDHEVIAVGGGFRTEILFEDVLFYGRIRRVGYVLALEPPVRTSDRRWRTRGYLRTNGLNLLLRLLFLLRRRPARLASIYGRHA